MQPTQCGGQVIAAVGDYLARYDVPAREATDVRWAQVCMELEDTVERLDALFEPVFARRMQEKLWQALYYRYDFAKEYRPQLEENLLWLDGELKKLEGMQMRHRTIEKVIDKITLIDNSGCFPVVLEWKCDILHECKAAARCDWPLEY